MPRKALAFEELDNVADARGRGAILRTREEVNAENQLAETLENQKAVKPELIKKTYRVERAHEEAVDNMHLDMKRRFTTRIVNHDDVAQAAFMLLYRDWQENPKDGFLARWISGKPEKQKDGKL